MMKNAPLIRPAASAIAAFLVLSTPVAFAQEAPTMPMAPPVVAPPASAPPTVQPPAAVAPATAPTAQPVIRVPLDLPPVPKVVEREAATPPRARAERPAARARAAQPAPARVTAARAEPVAAEPVAITSAPIDDVAPIAPPVVEPVQPVAEAAPAPVAKATTSGDSLPWEIAGGAAALLIAGGAGLAFARRRRASTEVWDFDNSASNAEWAPTTEPTFVAREETIVASPPAPASQANTPSFATAPHGSMGRHEALAMAGPTPENPFPTLSKRLARARFLDRQERTEYDATLVSQQEPARKPVSAWEIAQRQAPVAPTEQEVRRLEPGRTVRTDLKPSWTKS